MLRPYKFQIVAICQEINDDGEVTGEQLIAGDGNQPIAVFGLDGLREFADNFEAKLREVQIGSDNSVSRAGQA